MVVAQGQCACSRSRRNLSVTDLAFPLSGQKALETAADAGCQCRSSPLMPKTRVSRPEWDRLGRKNDGGPLIELRPSVLALKRKAAIHGTLTHKKERIHFIVMSCQIEREKIGQMKSGARQCDAMHGPPKGDLRCLPEHLLLDGLLRGLRSVAFLSRF